MPDLHRVRLLLQCDDPVFVVVEGVAKAAHGAREAAAVDAVFNVVAVVGPGGLAGVDFDGALVGRVEGV
jgi:hypothetical protein